MKKIFDVKEKAKRNDWLKVMPSVYYIQNHLRYSQQMPSKTASVALPNSKYVWSGLLTQHKDILMLYQILALQKLYKDKDKICSRFAITSIFYEVENWWTSTLWILSIIEMDSTSVCLSLRANKQMKNHCCFLLQPAYPNRLIYNH